MIEFSFTLVMSIVGTVASESLHWAIAACKGVACLTKKRPVRRRAEAVSRTYEGMIPIPAARRRG